MRVTGQEIVYDNYPVDLVQRRPRPPVVDVRNIGYTYPMGVDAVRGASFSAAEGELLGIVGPSGCGKSTLLRIVAGLLKPTTGETEFNDGGQSDRHPISMVFQSDTLLPWLTLEGNVGLFQRLQTRTTWQRLLPKAWRRPGSPGHATPKEKEVAERVDWLLALGGLSDYRHLYPYQLSGGMRRRAAFLAGVAPFPRLLLLDEPFSSVDEPTRIGIHQDVLRILKEFGITTILVTHDLAEAASLCDRVLTLSQRPGKVADECVISFPEDRDLLSLRKTPEFLQVYGELWEVLSIEIRRQPRGIRPTGQHANADTEIERP